MFLSHAFASGQTDSDVIISKDEIAQVLKNSQQAIQQHYIAPAKVERITNAIGARQKLAKFQQDIPFARLKQELEHVLISASGDSSFEIKRREMLSNDSDNEHFPSAIQTQILDNNIGMLSITGDLTYFGVEHDISVAMGYLQSVDGLIIDLRNAGSGTLKAAIYLMNYLLEADTVLSDITYGNNQSERIFSTNPSTNALKKQPSVYVLTSSFVAGTWEFFTYTLKHLNAATVVGEDTMGVGRMTTAISMSENVRLVLAYAETKHPITSDNWQSVGVIAEYQTNAAQSEDVAYRMLLEQLKPQP